MSTDLLMLIYVKLCKLCTLVTLRSNTVQNPAWLPRVTFTHSSLLHHWFWSVCNEGIPFLLRPTFGQNTQFSFTFSIFLTIKLLNILYWNLKLSRVWESHVTKTLPLWFCENDVIFTLFLFLKKKSVSQWTVIVACFSKSAMWQKQKW